MKKVKLLLLVMIFMLSINTFTVFASNSQVKIIVNGKNITFDQEPIIQNGRVLVPVRAISEALGYEVFYDNYKKMYYEDVLLKLKEDGNTTRNVCLYYDNALIDIYTPFYGGYMRVDSISLEPKPVVVNGRTLIGIKDLGDALEANVVWDGNTKTVTVTKQKNDNSTSTNTSTNNNTNNNNSNNNLPVENSTNQYETILDAKTTFNHIINGEFTRNYGGLVTDNLFYIDNQYVTVSINSTNNKLEVEKFDDNFNSVYYKEIPPLLESTGGVHYAKDGYFYVVYGNTNPQEVDSKESVRIVKYDKNFNSISSLSINSADTRAVEPFDFGSLRMADDGDKLAISTARLRYKSSDGVSHQSNLVILIDKSSMTKLHVSENFPKNHVSHSFNQFVLFTDNNLAFLDHGDAYPRAVILNTSDKNMSNFTKTTVQSIYGDIGNNYTGLFLAGFEQSDNNYIAVLNTIDQNTSNSDTRNAKYYIINKNNYKVDMHNITNFSETSKKMAGLMNFAKIDDNKFVILWEEIDSDTFKLIETKYMMIDGKGQILSKEKSLGNIKLTKNLTPIYNNGNLVWYYNDYYGKKVSMYKVRMD